MDRNLLRIEEFFYNDLLIKKMLGDIKPRIVDGYNQESILSYINNTLKVMNNIKYLLFKTVDDFHYDFQFKKIIGKCFIKLEENLLKCDSYDKLIRFYQSNCSNMNMNLINKTRNNLVGYTSFEDSLCDLIGECNTINEILHVVHSSIINNEEYYQSMTKIKEKINNQKYPVVLYGRKQPLFEKIFDNFPLDLDCGWVDIISLDNKMLMMVRDRGHALLIEVELNKNDILVKYSIPKICNIDMVNKLNGVKKVDNLANATTGMFITNAENFSMELFELIKGVPTDFDIIYERSQNKNMGYMELNTKDKYIDVKTEEINQQITNNKMKIINYFKKMKTVLIKNHSSNINNQEIDNEKAK